MAECPQRLYHNHRFPSAVVRRALLTICPGMDTIRPETRYSLSHYTALVNQTVIGAKGQRSQPVNWILSPAGIDVTVTVIIVIATLIYWKREPIKRWLGRQQVEELELSAGPLKGKGEEKQPASPPGRRGAFWRGQRL